LSPQVASIPATQQPNGRNEHRRFDPKCGLRRSVTVATPGLPSDAPCGEDERGPSSGEGVDRPSVADPHLLKFELFKNLNNFQQKNRTILNVIFFKI
jgi:hypothetical protein